MKLYKVFGIALAALTMTACSDDDEFNTASGVSVAMKYDTMQISEDYSGTYYNIPVVVNGNPNNAIKVEVEVSAQGTSPATEGEHFLVTSKSIIIPEGATEGNIEFYPVGDEEVNEDRQFIVTIVKAEGATVADNASTVVTLMDNERLIPEAYENVQGEWLFECSEPEDACILTITGHAEGEEGYLKTLTVSGWMGYEWVSIEVGFSFDAAKMAANLQFSFGQWCATQVAFNGLGVCDVMFAGVSGNNLVSSGSVIATVDSEYKNISIPASAEFVGALFMSETGSFTGKVWFWYDTMKMSRN